MNTTDVSDTANISYADGDGTYPASHTSGTATGYNNIGYYENYPNKDSYYLAGNSDLNQYIYRNGETPRDRQRYAHVVGKDNVYSRAWIDFTGFNTSTLANNMSITLVPYDGAGNQVVTVNTANDTISSSAVGVASIDGSNSDAYRQSLVTRVAEAINAGTKFKAFASYSGMDIETGLGSTESDKDENRCYSC